MAKTFVIDSSDDTRVPFLRGILTRSLHDAGLDFDEAYKLASVIRNELADVDEIQSSELRNRVLELLENGFSKEILEAYQSSGRIPATIMVRDTEGVMTPFSHAEHKRCLESCGLSSVNAEMASTRIHDHLIEKEFYVISSSKLGHLTYVCLHEHFGRKVAKRYMVWVDYHHSGRSLILLIGGTTGCGKSTIATEVAHRLGIVRTQSTDMLREVMRMMIPERLLPVLHTSSFNAWKSLPEEFSNKADDESLIATGYRSQMELLSVPCEAVIQRALRERVSMILEGVHVHHSLMDRINQREDAIIVPIMLAI